MIVPHLKYRKIFKISVVVLLLLTISGVAFGIMDFGKSPGNAPGRPSPAAIGNIYADKKQNLLKIPCSFPGKIHIGNAALSDLITINIRKKDTLFTDVYIKTIDSLSENTLLLGVQPPLKDAIYGIEKRDISVQFKAEKGIVEASGTVILSNAMQRLDLRAYKVSRPLTSLLKGTLVFLVISAVFMLLIPLIRKYNFKKHNIKKYRHITAEDKVVLDPFTFENMEEKDEVVVIDEHIILLRSWKRLHALKTEDRPGGFDMFFNEEEKNTLFKPLTAMGQRINSIWFGTLATYTAWLFYAILMQLDMEAYRSLLSGLFDSVSKQFSGLVYSNSILATGLGLAAGLVFLAVKKLYGQDNIPVLKMIFRLVLGVMAFQFLFLFSYLFNAYLFNNNIFGSLIAWFCTGMGLSVITGTRSSIKKSLIAAGITGLVGFTAWQLCSLNIFLDMLSTEIILLISLMFTGGVSGGLTYTRLSVREEMSRDKDIDVTDHIEAASVSDDEPTLKKVG